MFCPKCGQQIADNTVFCPHCGNQLSAASSQPAYEQPADSSYQQSVYVHPTPAPAASGVAVVKKLCASPVVLVAIIAYTAAALFSLITSLSGANDIAGFLEQLPEIPGLDIDAIVRTTQAASIGGAIIGILPTALLALGMWLAYASAASKQNPGMTTGGLTLVKTILIIQLVFVCIGLGSLGILTILLMVSAAALGGHRNADFSMDGPGGSAGPAVGIAAGVAVVVFIFVVAVLILYLVYYVKSIKTVNTISMTARTGKLSDNISMFVAVMSFIMGGFTVFSVFDSKTFDVLLTNICSATASISFGVFLCIYRSQMRQAMAGGVPVNAPQQQAYATASANPYNTQAQDPSAPQNAYFPSSEESDQPTDYPQ